VNNKKAVTEENTGGHLTNTNKIQKFIYLFIYFTPFVKQIYINRDNKVGPNTKTFIRKHCKNTGTKYTRLIN